MLGKRDTVLVSSGLVVWKKSLVCLYVGKNPIIGTMRNSTGKPLDTRELGIDDC